MNLGVLARRQVAQMGLELVWIPEQAQAVLVAQLDRRSAYGVIHDVALHNGVVPGRILLGAM